MPPPPPFLVADNFIALLKGVQLSFLVEYLFLKAEVDLDVYHECLCLLSDLLNFEHDLLLDLDFDGAFLSFFFCFFLDPWKTYD